jgi:hypothetical protein
MAKAERHKAMSRHEKRMHHHLNKAAEHHNKSADHHEAAKVSMKGVVMKSEVKGGKKGAKK